MASEQPRRVLRSCANRNTEFLRLATPNKRRMNKVKVSSTKTNSDDENSPSKARAQKRARPAGTSPMKPPNAKSMTPETPVHLGKVSRLRVASTSLFTPTREAVYNHAVSSSSKSVTWPARFDHMDYMIIPRASFEDIRVLKPGGLGVVLAAELDGVDVVLKLVLDPDDWNEELAGYTLCRDNPGIVGVLSVTLLPGAEINEMCENIKEYVLRRRYEHVPAMVFKRWAGSLTDAISNGRVADWGLAGTIKLMADIADYLSALHEEGSMHRDIKGDNILYMEHDDGTVAVALCDLGLSKSLEEAEEAEDADRIEMTQGVGTKMYMAPECKNGTYYTESADIFSLAVTCEEVCRPACKFRADMPLSLLSLLANGRSRYPEKRPTASQFRDALLKIHEELLARTKESCMR